MCGCDTYDLAKNVKHRSQGHSEDVERREHDEPPRTSLLRYDIREGECRC